MAFAGAVWTMLGTTPVGALSLKIAPLEYRTELKQGEKKKGFIDVSNPTGQRFIVRTSVEGFKQTSNEGALSFYKSEHISTGIQLDLDEFELGPREAVRMYFQLDGTKLPSGDVFGAVFFTAAPANKPTGVEQAVRLGTLFSIVNGTPGSRDAKITNLSVPWLQLSDTISGSYSIKNTADPNKATGFYPTTQLKASPFGEAKKQTGKLTFAGITRTNEFSLKTLPIGIYQVSVSFTGSKQSSWVVVVSPVAAIIFVAMIFVGTAAWRYTKKRRTRLILGASKTLRK